MSKQTINESRHINESRPKAQNQMHQGNYFFLSKVRAVKLQNLGQAIRGSKDFCSRYDDMFIEEVEFFCQEIPVNYLLYFQ